MNILFKILKNGGIFVLLLLATGYMVFRDNDISAISAALPLIRPFWLLLSIFAMSLFVFCEGENIARSLRLFGENVTRGQAVKYALTGFFFSAVTPSASGGQPMQLFAMHKDGIKVTNGTIALLFELLSFEMVTVALSIIGYIFQHRQIAEAMGSMSLLLLIGVAVNCVVMSLLLAAIFSKKAMSILSGFLVRVISLFSRETAGRIQQSLARQLCEYRESAEYFKTNKMIFAKTLFTSLIQILAMYSIPYLIYLGFGLSGYSLTEFLSLQAVLYVAVSALPLPGAVGVSESGFLRLFRLLFPAELLKSAMLLSRGISFYLFVLISGIAAAGFALKCSCGQPVSLNSKKLSAER